MINIDDTALRELANELMQEAGIEVARRAHDDSEIRELMSDYRPAIGKIVALAVEIGMLKALDRLDNYYDLPASPSPSQIEELPLPPLTGDLPALSTRELQVLRSLSHGKSNKTIAREIGTDEAKVKIHVKTIFRKIRVNNRTRAAVWARSRGIADGRV